MYSYVRNNFSRSIIFTFNFCTIERTRNLTNPIGNDALHDLRLLISSHALVNNETEMKNFVPFNGVYCSDECVKKRNKSYR